MTKSEDHSSTEDRNPSTKQHTGKWIAVGLLLGLAAGLLFGEYCRPLEVIGMAYVGLLQMTVLPYLIMSLVSKMGRLDKDGAKRLGLAAVIVLLVLWVLGIVVVVLVSGIFPPLAGASFYSPASDVAGAHQQDFLSMFIPANVFRSLSSEYVPAVIVFCLFFGGALMLMPGKEPLLQILDICAAGIGRMNVFLVRFAPLGLFTLTAAAAGTLRLEELSRLQGYLIIFSLACLWMAFGVLPLLLSSFTSIRYRDLLRAAHEPLLTAIATGKLFVVLPQIADKCEQLLRESEGAQPSVEESTVEVLVPMAYPFPHVGKILAFVFISFAAWYTGQMLSPVETAAMAATGTASSFASPLITMPYLLDRYQLPQDLMVFFLLPGFITMRLGDVVGVVHLMVLTLIVNQVVQRRLEIHWRRLVAGIVSLALCLFVVGGATYWYLKSTTLEYDLDQRLLAIEVPSPYENSVVYRSRQKVPELESWEGSTLDRIKANKVLRVGYHADHLPYSFFNSKGELVGLDVELMYRLAERMELRLEFVPYSYDSVVDQLETGQIDVAVGGLIMKPERLLRVGFTQSYQTATVAVLLADHRRGELDQWKDPHTPQDLRLAVVHEDLAVAARRQLPHIEFIVIDSISSFFSANHRYLDGLVIAAEEGAAWNILYPEYTVVVPQPSLQRPVGMALRLTDRDLLRFLDRWLEFERLEGSLDRLRTYWVEGGGTRNHVRRWSILQDELQWLP